MGSIPAGGTKLQSKCALRRILRLVPGGAMFRQQAKPRAGVEKILSDGEELFVTTTPQQINLIL